MLSILKCEIITIIHGEEIFGKSYIDNGLNIKNGYFRVLSYDNSNVKVYEANINKGGFIWEYRNINGKWILIFKTPLCVWSKTGGNAAETVWPYWWHFIYWDRQ